MPNLQVNHTNANLPSLQERAEHREWIGGRVLTLLSHYWRDSDSDELTAAIGADWADVLEGMTQDAIRKACIQYQRDEPRRKPTPGEIYQRARAYMPAPKVVAENEPEPSKEKITAKKAREIWEEAGVRVDASGRVNLGIAKPFPKVGEGAQ